MWTSARARERAGGKVVGGQLGRSGVLTTQVTIISRYRAPAGIKVKEY